MVSVKDWQKRGFHNELEANQIQVSSLILLTHMEDADLDRVKRVKTEIEFLNPHAKVMFAKEFDTDELFSLNENNLSSPQKMDHHKSHWASCSIDLPDPMPSKKLKEVLDRIPDTVLRIKGCTKLDEDEHYTHFERVPNSEVFMRPYNGAPYVGPKLIAVGPGSDPDALRGLLN